MAERIGRRGVLLAAAGSLGVAVVAAGTSYAGRGGSGSGDPADPRGHRPPLPPLPPLQTDAGNRAAAVAAAVSTLAAMPVHPGAFSSDPLPALGDDSLSTVTPAGHTEVRSGYWTVPGSRPRAVAEWYAAHRPAGFPPGGGVGSQSDGRTVVFEVYDDPPGTGLGSPGTSVEVQTTAVGDGAGVRVTVSSVWAPARPRTSYVQDVRSIDVRSVHARYAQDTKPTVRSFTVTDPAQMLQAAVVLNGLSGMTAVPIPCPMALESWVDRIVFHTATGDVSVVHDSRTCGFGLVVRRDGQRVAPLLTGAATLLPTLGLEH